MLPQFFLHGNATGKTNADDEQEPRLHDVQFVAIISASTLEIPKVCSAPSWDNVKVVERFCNCRHCSNLEICNL